MKKRKKAQPLDYLLATDGSCQLSKKTKRHYASFAAVMVNLKTLEKTALADTVSGRTIAYAEAYAVYRGLREIARLVGTERDVAVLVLTDSKMTIATINAYIPKLWNREGDVWTRADGAPVRNQDLFKKLVKLLDEHPNIHMKVVHIKAHTNANKTWEDTKKRLAQWGVTVDEGAARMCIALNAEADRRAKHCTVHLMRDEEENGMFFRLSPIAAYHNNEESALPLRERMKKYRKAKKEAARAEAERIGALQEAEDLPLDDYDPVQ